MGIYPSFLTGKNEKKSTRKFRHSHIRVVHDSSYYWLKPSPGKEGYHLGSNQISSIPALNNNSPRNLFWNLVDRSIHLWLGAGDHTTSHAMLIYLSYGDNPHEKMPCFCRNPPIRDNNSIWDQLDSIGEYQVVIIALLQLSTQSQICN